MTKNAELYISIVITTIISKGVLILLLLLFLLYASGKPECDPKGHTWSLSRSNLICLKTLSRSRFGDTIVSDDCTFDD